MIQDRIPAGGNLWIDAQATRWRLLIQTNGVERTLVEAETGQPIRYAAAFAAQRRLDDSAVLRPEEIDQVVVGWSNKDESWHLGLMLSAALAQARGSRWCELAHWEDPLTTRHPMTASAAGERLATVIGRPFAFVKAKTDAPNANPVPPPAPSAPRPAFELPPSRRDSYASQPSLAADAALPLSDPYGHYVVPAAPVPAPAAPLNPALSAPPPPLPPLPIALDSWILRQPTPALLVLERVGSWGRTRLLRTLWYTFLSGVFLLLSVGSLTSGIALPRIGPIRVEFQNRVLVDIPSPPPETLVIAGFFCAALMLVLAFAQFIGAVTAIKRIEIDGEMRTVRGMQGRRPAWTIPAAELEAVYATLVVQRIHLENRPRTRKVSYGELTLLEKEGTFTFLGALGSMEPIPVTDTATNDDVVLPLTLYAADTPIQVAALAIGRTLNLPARCDQRVR
ncbi:MAG: hypothetical protein SF162_01475 [bacterium]|nr:hypothetical protein [bacterium]